MLLVIARGLFVACALSGFGAALFALTMPIARHVDARLHASIERQVRKIISLSLAAAMVVGYAWLLRETHAVASTTNLAQTVTAIPTVLFDTRFGQILALQAIAIAFALVAIWRGRNILAASPAGAAVMLEAGHSHAFAMAHIPLLLSQMLHLTAAGAWLRSPRGAARGAAVESPLVRSVDLDRRRQSLLLDTGVRRTEGREGQEGSRAQHWDRNCSRSLRGVCREPAQQPRAWNAYGNPRSVTPSLWPLARVLAKMA
jgi:hypothetical protein